jgi:hypothetical protein
MQSPREHRSSQDVSGYAVFAAGDIGSMHVMAHEMLDRGLFEQGHRRLGAWLRGRTGAGSEWVHLQWHMAVFELALGDWDAAHARFQKFVLPAAATGQDALTDAPAMLWRLSLEAPRPVRLPWEPVRATALESLRRPADPYVELHGLLALAGARDAESLEQWLARRGPAGLPRAERLVWRMGEGLQAYASGNYRRAAAMLSEVVPHVSEIGGSRAQNELFVAIEKACRRLVEADGRLPRVA